MNKLQEYLDIYGEMFLTEGEKEAVALANELHKTKKAKSPPDNDATFPEINKALKEKFGDKYPKKYLKTVTRVLTKKGYKVWKEFTKKGYGGKFGKK